LPQHQEISQPQCAFNNKKVAGLELIIANNILCIHWPKPAGLAEAAFEDVPNGHLVGPSKMALRGFKKSQEPT